MEETYEKPILLVDDEEAVVQLLSDYLETKNLKSLMCTDSTQAIALLREHPVEVVVLDYTMPGKNGLIVLKEINELAAQTKRPFQVIMLTAQVDAKVALELLRNNVFIYVNKPPKFREFLGSIKDAIDRYRDLSAEVAGQEEQGGQRQHG